MVLLRKKAPTVEPSFIDFIRSHRKGVWEIEDSDQTTAKCLLCTAAHDERQNSIAKISKKRLAREVYAASAVSLTLSLIGRAALYRFEQHEGSKQHLTNLVHARRLEQHQKIPDELWKNISFVCAGINLSSHKAVGLEAYHVGGCLGMSAVAAFSRRS